MRAERFLLIGLIAVVRRILALTVSIEQNLVTPELTRISGRPRLSAVFHPSPGTLRAFRRRQLGLRPEHRPESTGSRMARNVQPGCAQRYMTLRMGRATMKRVQKVERSPSVNTVAYIVPL